MNSIKSQWVDLKTLRDDAQKPVTAKERLRYGLRAVQCFDQLFINNNDQVTLQVLVRDLVHLGLYNIDNKCINGMISEL